jgi:hypothetical protein
MSPVETCGFPVNSTILAACVPLPAPGGPNSTIEPVIVIAKEEAQKNEARLGAVLLPPKVTIGNPLIHRPSIWKATMGERWRTFGELMDGQRGEGSSQGILDFSV